LGANRVVIEGKKRFYNIKQWYSETTIIKQGQPKGWVGKQASHLFKGTAFPISEYSTIAWYH
jgi:hypothetical protein